MLCRATQDRPVMVESSVKTWSTGEGNGKPLQHSCLENPMNFDGLMNKLDLQTRSWDGTCLYVDDLLYFTQLRRKKGHQLRKEKRGSHGDLKKGLGF